MKRLTRAPLPTSSNTLHGPFMWYIKKGQGVGLYAGGGVSLNESYRKEGRVLHKRTDDYNITLSGGKRIIGP